MSNFLRTLLLTGAVLEISKNNIVNRVPCKIVGFCPLEGHAKIVWFV